MYEYFKIKLILKRQLCQLLDLRDFDWYNYVVCNSDKTADIMIKLKILNVREILFFVRTIL